MKRKVKPFHSTIGSGKYGVYLANYAAYGNNGLVGAHTILEMDEDSSSGNDIILNNVGEEAGVKRFTGNHGWQCYFHFV